MLTINNLSVSYGKARVINQLELHIHQGEMLSVIGPNGAGKTTLLRCISGLIMPNEGEIKFEGKAIHGLPAHKIARLGITHCPEGRRLFPEMTVLENLMMGGLNIKKQQIGERLEYVHQLFPILKARESQYAGTMSGGQQQMVAIGRALMTSPKLLILDEPSIGLAPLVVSEIFEQIRVIKESGVTILLVEQNVDVALTITDRIAVMDNGRISFIGSPSNLLNDNSLREIYLGI
ncbi:ABC transporter ATP-binding protein [Bacillus sp. V5-8f]|uniref:ABC transporter ATP-binding protein n=1 Tax=Bacillus sp. V5-8f TaxID=2053044 RepID=UPI000C75B68F|nr:ABC transporter ATP-binding protein [Bacillus sp. V5-8f]PLT33329.1 ABC transporter ATP-binding protein [Bacillus sp. V5-8f]